MTKLIKTSSKRFFAIMMTIILIVGMIPISSPLHVLSAVAPTITVEVDKEIKGNIIVTLTNEEDSTDTLEKSIINGEAIFSNFYNSDESYKLEIKGMIGYEDYSETGITDDRHNISYKDYKFTKLETIEVSGQITNEDGFPYMEGGVVSYDGYDTGLVNLENNGTFKATIYKNKDYTFYLTPTNFKYTSPVTLGSVNSEDDINNLNAQFPFMTSSFSVNADGKITWNNIAHTEVGQVEVIEGENPSFKVDTKENYYIKSVLIDGVENIDVGNTTTTSFELTFTDVDATHTVSVSFAINQFEIEIVYPENGTITVNGISAKPKQTVNYGEDLTLLLTPYEGYYVGGVLLDGSPVDNYTSIDDDIACSYVLSSIRGAHTIEVIFTKMEVLTENISKYVDIIYEDKNIIEGYPMTSGGVKVYNFLNNNDASITFKVQSPYTKISIKNSGNGTSIRFTNSVLITKIQVCDNSKLGWNKWFEVEIDPIQIIFDKTAPNLVDIPSMEWTNKDKTIVGEVRDGDNKELSSGLERVVYSENTLLDKALVLAEAENVVDIIDKTYSFTIEGEQNNTPFYVYAIDKAGNVSNPQTIYAKIDKTAPEVTEFEFKRMNADVGFRDINFLPSGTFYNNEIEVKVTAQDTGIATSGVKEITLYSNSNDSSTEIGTKLAYGGSATFTLTLEDFKNNVISASAKDNAGNESDKKKPTEVTTNAKSDVVSLKTEKPTISIVSTSEAIHTNGEENWYGDNVEFTVTVGTESSGINSVRIKINDKIIEADKNDKVVEDNFSESETMEEIFTINTDQNPIDGKNVIEVIAVNNYGNDQTAIAEVFIDTTNPKIVGFNIDKENDDVISKIFRFLTFGNFFNEKVRITVIADDRYGATSGISTITLYADGEPIGSPQVATALDDGTYKAEFILPENILPETRLLDVALAAVATDNVANITGKDDDNPDGVPVTPTIINSNLKSDKLIIETVNPVIDISFSEAVFTDCNNKNWYSDDVSFIATVKDEDSGINSVQIKINDIDILTDADGKSVNSDFYNTETHEEVFRINTNQGISEEDGSYLIEVTVIDNAGNEYSASNMVYKDTDNPSITGYRFIPETSNGISETSEFIEYLEYGFYFKTEFTTVIQITDQEPSSGLDRIEYRLVSYQNGAVIEETNGTQNVVDGMALLTIPQGFKGQVFVKAFDHTGNVSSEETTRAFVIDDICPEISITNNDTTNYKDANDNKLYVSDMSFSVVVSDSDSGIKEIGYSQSAENESLERKSILVNNMGYNVGDILEDDWVVLEMDSNLVTKLTKTFSFSSDDNDIVLTFDVKDNSGNKTENIQSEEITIDKTPPVINVAFRNDESKNNYYYNANRIADVTVIERNFDPNLIMATIENEYGQVPTVSFTEISKTEYVAVIDFDEGDYTFDVTGKDLGNHEATINFSGGNEKLFYVDKTSPVVEENFAEFSNSATENSFNTDKTVTIKVTEHNFDPDLINLKVTQKEAGEEHSIDELMDATMESVDGSEWVSDGDTHTISFTLSRDAVYQVEISPTDLAENVVESRSTVVFEVDQTAPSVWARNDLIVDENDIEFLDVYPYLRKDDPAPTVEFYDLNIDHINYVLTMYIPDYTSSEAITVIRPVRVYLDEDSEKSGKIKGNIFTLPNFIEDGIYSVELIAVDIAGNESLLNVNTYARMVEQDVLAYILDSNLAEKTGVYSFQYENGDAISKRPDNFSDIKIFVLTKKDTGIDIVLRDNNADEIITNAQATIDDSIYGVGIYNFTLKADFFKENFQDDTDVELHLAVKNEGGRIDLGKMHIDNIAPTCNIPQELKSWNWYYGDDNQTITISNISELIDENQCKVYDNGKEIEFEYSSEDNNLEFTLEKGWHNVGIIINDIAGNANNIEEKENIHIGFFWLWVSIVSSVILVIIVAFIIIRNIRKKRNLESD